MPSPRQRKPWSPAAKFVFSYIGRGKRFRSQYELITAAGIGKSALVSLRDKPKQMRHEHLVRIAQVIGVDPSQIYDLIPGLNLPSADEIERIIEEFKQSKVEGDGVRFDSRDFFEEIARRSEPNGLLLASLVPGTLLASRSKTMTDLTLKMLRSGACIALHVPVYLDNQGEPVDGDGFIENHFGQVFHQTKAYLQDLIKNSKGMSAAAARRQVGLFVLSDHVSRDIFRVLIPHEQRIAFICMPKRKSKADWIISTWSSNSVTGDQFGTTIVYEVSKYHHSPIAAKRLGWAQEVFGHLSDIWESGKKCSLAKDFPGRFWRRVDLTT